ncbi:hypothetical protein CT694_35230 (plasmid) [Bacillus wiedmannii bv. thuringiensis]|nr:hypothetical protein CT694_35230 [Bacillus wiedmannii bv. thuringiensis]
MVIKKVARMTWEKCFLFYVLSGNGFPKGSVFVCRCFLFYRYTRNLGKVFLLKEETLQIESEKLAGYD